MTSVKMIMNYYCFLATAHRKMLNYNEINFDRHMTFVETKERFNCRNKIFIRLK